MAAALLALGGCTLDTAGHGTLGGIDSGTRRDGGPGYDAGVDIDAAPPPPCATTVMPVDVLSIDGLAGGTGFSAPDAVLDQVELDATGAIVLPGGDHRYGALLFEGYVGTVFGGTPDLVALDSHTPSGAAFVGAMDQTFNGGAVPKGLRLTGEDSFSVRASGEIFLRSGSNRIELNAEDRGVLEIDVEGRLVSSVATDAISAARVDVEVAADAWYPIRFAWEDAGMNSSFSLTGTLGTGTETTVPAQSLRFDARHLGGRELVGYDAATLDGTPNGSRVDADDSDADYMSGYPEDVGITNGDTWAVRWLGRTLLPTDGGTLDLVANDAYRLWVDGVFVAGAYGPGALDDTRSLWTRRGLHDFVVELEDAMGDASIAVHRDAAPIGAARSRPALRFGGLAYGRGASLAASIAAGGMNATTLAVGAPTFSPTAVEISAVVVATDPAMVRVSARDPGGGNHDATLAEHSLASAGTWIYRLALVGGAAPADVDGTWTITVHNDGPDAIEVRTVGVLAHFGGVATPLGSAGRFVSGAIDLGEPYLITGVRLDADLPWDTQVYPSVRIADSVDALASAPRLSVDASGALPTPAAGRVVQVRLDLNGPGHDTPHVYAATILGARCAL